MIAHYLTTALRHFRKRSLYAAINVIGLVIGITAMLLAIMYRLDETGFDRFHKLHNDLYRITTTLKETKDADPQTTGGTGQVQGPAFQAAVPEIKAYTRVMGGAIQNDIVAGNKTLKVQPLFVDRNFLSVFTFPVMRGNAATALDQVNSVVLTETTASRLFNTTDVVGKILQMDADPSFDRLQKPLMISAVVKDPPANSSLQFDVLFPFSFMQLAFDDHAWLNAYLGTFVVLDPNANITQVTKKFNEIYSVHASQQLSDHLRTYGYDPVIRYGLQPFTDIHFQPLAANGGGGESGIINGSRSLYSIVFLVVASFLLLMAVINFVNLSMAGALKRSKEVGIRKVSGGSAIQIILQFLTESALLCIFAFLLSLVLLQALFPLLSELTGRQIQWEPGVLAYFVLLLLVVMAFTGIYPAYLLSRFRAHEVLYQHQRLPGRNLAGRALVIVQFAPAVFLLIAAIVFYRQMDYLHTKELGYNPMSVLRTAVTGNRDYEAVARFLRNELKKEPSIKSVSFGNSGQNFHLAVNGKNIEAFHKTIDENYLPLLEVPMLLGRNLSSAVTGDAQGVIVNESFVKAAGLQYPIGATVQLGDYYNKQLKVITGVVKDFHFQSLRLPVSPMILFFPQQQEGELWVKVEKAKTREGIAALEKTFHAAMPSAVFQYAFLNDLNAREFQMEARWQKGMGVITLFSLFVCSLGLFGMAHLSVYQRLKEIGIRKVLGASITQIVSLLCGKFVKLVVIAFLVAAPLAWIIMNTWLQNFAYRIHIGPLIFALAGLMAFGVTILAIASVSIRGATASPVSILKSE